MTKKDITLIAIIVIIAVIASNITMLYILRTIPFIHSNDFIAIAVALIGIMVTFAIGYQIFTTLDIKQQTSKINEINELQKKLEGLALKVEMENCLISANRTNREPIVNSVNELVNLYIALLLRLKYTKYLNKTAPIETSTFTYSEYKHKEYFEYRFLRSYSNFVESIILHNMLIETNKIFEVLPNTKSLKADLYSFNYIADYIFKINDKFLKLDIGNDLPSRLPEIQTIKKELDDYITHYYESNKSLINLD